MDREVEVHEYELISHEVTLNRLITLMDEQGKTLLNVPMEMFAVKTFFRCLMQAEEAEESPESPESQAVPAHRMFLDTIEALGGTLQKVVIDELKKGLFFATLHLVQNGVGVTVRAEATDALALAFTASRSVYIKESILDLAKTDVENRVRWYAPDDTEGLKVARRATHEVLRRYRYEELTQLIEMAAGIEDYELAERLKKALQEKI
jgi:bifunctional DNase/RNase